MSSVAMFTDILLKINSKIVHDKYQYTAIDQCSPIMPSYLAVTQAHPGCSMASPKVMLVTAIPPNSTVSWDRNPFSLPEAYTRLKGVPSATYVLERLESYLLWLWGDCVN